VLIVGAVIVILAIAAVVGMILWNHRNRGIAQAGVEFVVPAPGEVVVDVVRSSYCGGTKATAKRLLSGLTVTSSGATSFRYASRIGDEGVIEVVAQQAGTALVRARATSLYVGSHPMTHSRRAGLWGFCTAISHGIYVLLGITPNAAKAKRFHNSLQRRVQRQIARSPAQPA
jgi:hypothetical protein